MVLKDLGQNLHTRGMTLQTCIVSGLTSISPGSRDLKLRGNTSFVCHIYSSPTVYSQHAHARGTLCAIRISSISRLWVRFPPKYGDFFFRSTISRASFHTCVIHVGIIILYPPQPSQPCAQGLYMTCTLC